MIRKKHSSDFMKVATLGVFVIMLVLIIFLQWKNASQDDSASKNESLPSTENLLNEIFAAQQAAFPKKSSQASLKEEAMVREEISLLSRDGIPITGIVSKPAGIGPFPAVVILHGGESSKRATQHTAEILGTALSETFSLLTLTVDWREGVMGEADLSDAISAVEWLKRYTEVDPKQVTLFGMDHGAYIALRAAEEVEVAGVIDAYGYTDIQKQYEHLQVTDPGSATNFLEQTGCHEAVNAPACFYERSIRGDFPPLFPVLVLHAAEDQFVPIDQSNAFVEKLGEQASVEYTQLTDPAVGHDFLLGPDIAGYEEGWKAIEDWLTVQLLPSQPTP